MSQTTVPATVDYRRLVDDFHRAFFQNHDAAATAQLYTEDALWVEPGLPAPARGRKAIEQGLAVLTRAFPDMSARVENSFGSGDWFAVELTVRGTNTGPLELEPGNVIPPTNKRVEMTVCWIGRISPDGLCAEDHTYYDMASMLEQLGIS